MAKVAPVSIFRRVFLSLLALLLALVAIIRAQQYAFRHRAEQLLTDVRSLDIGKASFADTQIVFKRWPEARNEGACASVQCDFEIALTDLASSRSNVFANRPWLLRIYGLMGGRPAQVNADVSVKNDTVFGKSFAALVEILPGEETQLFGGYGYTLIGEIKTLKESSPAYDADPRHPHYRIGWPGGCETCVAIYVRFAPSATPADFRRLTQFDMTCLTRWVSPCRTKADIMPVAWAEAERSLTN